MNCLLQLRGEPKRRHTNQQLSQKRNHQKWNTNADEEKKLDSNMKTKVAVVSSIGFPSGPVLGDDVVNRHTPKMMATAPPRTLYDVCAESVDAGEGSVPAGGGESTRGEEEVAGAVEGESLAVASGGVGGGGEVISVAGLGVAVDFGEGVGVVGGGGAATVDVLGLGSDGPKPGDVGPTGRKPFYTPKASS
uniref:Uncharacterized protein n=1 Tax=Oryza rufipogon TaxID=4529 RepID=A0A0E0PRL7_ORYRU